MLFFSDLSSLQDIADKIIPNDPIAICIQLASTFILVFLLAKFLVKPAREYVKKRQDYINGLVEDANNKNKEANELLEKANGDIAFSKARAKEIVDNAKIDALKSKEKLIEDANMEISIMKRNEIEKLEAEKKIAKRELENELASVAFDAASKVIEREVNKEDSMKAINDFLGNKDNG